MSARLADPRVHELFEARVDVAPGAVAVRQHTEALTYRELDDRANRLARRLADVGVGPGTLVGICLNRSLDVVVGLLAVLKAGGACVPLDPTHPRDRLEYLLDDAGARVLVARRDSPLADGRLVVTPGGEDTSACTPAARGVCPSVRSSDAAYVIYTSGSTGHPKGVVIEHWALCQYAEVAPEITPGPRRLFTAAIGFSASVRQLVLPLLYGHTVVVATDEDRVDVRRTIALLRDEAIGVWDTTPSQLEAALDLAEAGGVPWPPLVETVLVTGEPLTRSTARRLRALAGERVRLVNLYSQTETVGTVARHIVEPADEVDGAGAVAVGRPLADARIHVLDADLCPVATGGEGDIWVESPRLAREYLGDPRRSAAAFRSAPGGRRMYRTGDIGRLRADGALEVLGRRDRRVNVAGMRVELEEVEQALRRDPDVARAVVVEASGRLKALVVPSIGSEPYAREIRRRAAAWLPSYMVPTQLVLVDDLPLLPNGKLDWAKAASVRGERSLLAAHAPLATAGERLVAGLFERLLDATSVGADDDFFALGGDSLLATRLLARLRHATGRDVSLRELFATPTPRLLAAWLGAAPLKPDVQMPVATDRRMSFAQEQLWLAHELGGGGPAYNVARALRLTGSLDIAALDRALRATVARHDVLRARFALVDGVPEMLVDDIAVSLVVRAHPGSVGGDDARERALADAVDAEARRPFLLDEGPLLRALLLGSGDRDHTLVLTVHHIVCDRWSVDLLLAELGALYRGETLPPPPVRYADVAAWQRDRLRGPLLDDLLSYWRKWLAGLPPLLDLPTDRPRPPTRTFAGASLPARVPRRLVDRLQRRKDTTLFVSLLTGFAVLLGRWSGRDDVALGVPFAGRTRVETESLLGFFVNTLVLRVDLSGDPTVAELLDRVREVTLDAHRFSELPFERLVQELAPDRSPAYNPLVQTMLVLQNTPGEAVSMPGLEVAALPVNTGTSRFDLSLVLVEDPDGLDGLVEYSEDLFSEATARRFAEQFVDVLTDLSGDPGRRLSELGAGREVDGPAAAQEACVHELFEAQVDRSPDAPAVRRGDLTVPYRELDRRANRLARRLAARGVGRGTIVGVRAERTIELVVALLAVLKAGGGYVPLDPAYPAERLEFMVADSGAAFVLTAADCRDLAGPSSPAGEDSDARLPGQADPTDVANVIYTSGSTGRPNAVVIEHRSLANVAAAQRAVFGLNAGTDVLQLSSLSFDAATFELMLALLAGGCLVMGEPDELVAGARPGSAVVVPPSVFDRIHGLLPNGVTVICAGERCRPEHVAAWRGRGAFYNAYGPTEGSIWSTTFKAATDDAVDPPPAVPVPIGVPIAGVTARVLDGHLRPVPQGVVGELYLGGAGVSRGYLGQPALTAERFVPDPGGEGRLYRTGDRVRRRSDGNLEFIGRRDGQVKVRGHRVELGEVEAALPGSVVVARDGRLVAYARKPVDIARARAVLPDYLVPTEIVLVEAWPLTANGKLDHSALPEPGPPPTAEYQAPATAVERALAAIWANVLGVDRVGVTDDFFGCGGDSIAAIHASARARRAGLVMFARDVVVYPTIAALAPHVTSETPPVPWKTRETPPEPAVVGGAYRPEDFPDAGISAEELDRVLARLRRNA